MRIDAEHSLAKNIKVYYNGIDISDSVYSVIIDEFALLEKHIK